MENKYFKGIFNTKFRDDALKKKFNDIVKELKWNTALSSFAFEDHYFYYLKYGKLQWSSEIPKDLVEISMYDFLKISTEPQYEIY